MARKSTIASNIRSLSSHFKRLLEGEKVLKDMSTLEMRVERLERRQADLEKLVAEHMLRERGIQS